MRQERGGEVQEADCWSAHWRRSDEEGESTKLQKTDGHSEAFETCKWKTKAIWAAQAKGLGIKRIDEEEVAAGREVFHQGATSVTGRGFALSSQREECRNFPNVQFSVSLLLPSGVPSALHW